MEEVLGRRGFSRIASKTYVWRVVIADEPVLYIFEGICDICGYPRSYQVKRITERRSPPARRWRTTYEIVKVSYAEDEPFCPYLAV